MIAFSIAAWILLRGLSLGFADWALLIATYAVAAEKGLRWGLAAVAVNVLVTSAIPFGPHVLWDMQSGTLSVFAVIAGCSMRVGRRINRELGKETDLLHRTRRERARLAVTEERIRVAREMHDMVAHAVTGMVVQAGGARMVVTEDPRLAATTLEDVQEMGREALSELRGLVEALDPSSALTRSEPREGPLDLYPLIERVRRAGQEVAFTEDGDPAPVDEGLRISLYRIIQEGLTNVRKHAPGTWASVSIGYRREAVEVRIINSKPPTVNHSTAVPGAGQGLIGIRERASVFGGTVEAGPTPEGGFQVSVRLPLELVPA